MNRHPDADYLSAEIARDNARRAKLVDMLCWALAVPAFMYLMVIASRQC